MMEKDLIEDFDNICAKLNIDHLNKAYAIEKYKEVTNSTLLDVSCKFHLWNHLVAKPTTDILRYMLS